MATIRDVARAAGVSPSTASRVLNGRAISVATETRERILQATDTLGYQPNASAQNLRFHKTRTVGVLVPDLTNPFFPEVLEGIRTAAAQEDFFILLANTVEDRERERAYIKLLQEKRVDGLIISTAGELADEETLVSEMQKGRFPYVLVCRPIPGAERNFVGADDLGGASLAVNHLISLGHRRIAHLCGPLFAGSALRRLQGYRKCLKEHGIPFDGQLVVETDFSEESGYHAMKKLLAGTPPTAVFAANDFSALGALRACEEAGLQVPGDISIVGFNDITLAVRSRPQLTTVHMPLAELGSAAFQLLQRLMCGEEGGGPIIFPTSLAVRQSTGPAPHGKSYA